MNAMAAKVPRTKPETHYCGFYDSEEDRRQLSIMFVHEGVGTGEKVIYIVNSTPVVELKQSLAAGGIDVEALTARGQLVILTAQDAYLRNGEFDPEQMIDRLRAETQQALAEGYPGLRATGEMTWALAGEPGSERLIEYESMLNTFFPGSKFRAICQYDRRRFDSELLLDVLYTHPQVLRGLNLLDNRSKYYVPPEAFLGADRASGMLNHWLQNLTEHGSAST